MSTVHAFFIAALSLYFVFWSDLFSDHRLAGLVTFRSSPLSTFGLGVRVFFLFFFFFVFVFQGSPKYIRKYCLGQNSEVSIPTY